MNETWYLIANDPLGSARVSILIDFLKFMAIFLFAFCMPIILYYKWDLKKATDAITILVSGCLLFFTMVAVVFFFTNYADVKESISAMSWGLTQKQCLELNGTWMCQRASYNPGSIGGFVNLTSNWTVGNSTIGSPD